MKIIDILKKLFKRKEGSLYRIGMGGFERYDIENDKWIHALASEIKEGDRIL